MDYSIYQKLFLIKQNSLKLLRYRNFDISRESSILTIDFLTFIKTYLNFSFKKNKTIDDSLTQIYNNNNDINNKLLVYFGTNFNKNKKLSFSVDNLNLFFDYIKRLNIINSILIIDNKLTSKASEIIKNSLNLNIQIFNIDELSYYPLDHYLVPKHTILCENQIKDLIKSNNLNLNNLPFILSNDPIIKFIGASVGDIILIKRINFLKSLTHSFNIYRLVVDSNYNRKHDYDANDDYLNSQCNFIN